MNTARHKPVVELHVVDIPFIEKFEQQVDPRKIGNRLHVAPEVVGQIQGQAIGSVRHDTSLAPSFATSKDQVVVDKSVEMIQWRAGPGCKCWTLKKPD